MIEKMIFLFLTYVLSNVLCNKYCCEEYKNSKIERNIFLVILEILLSSLIACFLLVWALYGSWNFFPKDIYTQIDNIDLFTTMF